MKTRIAVSILVLSVIVLLIIGGCATTAKITEQATGCGTLLVGRIEATCEDFAQMWNMNGRHTNNITIDLRNLSTNEAISIRSRGADGIFYIDDPEYGVYTIEKFSYTGRGSRTTFSLYHLLNDGVIFSIEKNAVYLLGDIEWYAKCIEKESKEYSRAASHYTYEVHTAHRYRKNFVELRNWFESTYPQSGWNDKNWINVEYVSK
jgi:hypothetical protein